MYTDKLIAIVGLIVSILGVLSIPKTSAGWAALGFGSVLLAISVVLLFRPSLKVIYSCYFYDFANSEFINNFPRVKIKKIVIYKANRAGITRLEASGLTSTGHYENFLSNLPGRIEVLTDDGGAIKVKCDIEQRLPVGKEVTWVLSYDAVNAFDSDCEEVCMACLSKADSGALHVAFSPKRPPVELNKVISKNKINRSVEAVFLNPQAPEIYWPFPIKFGLLYTIRWKW